MKQILIVLTLMLGVTSTSFAQERTKETFKPKTETVVADNEDGTITIIKTSTVTMTKERYEALQARREKMKDRKIDTKHHPRKRRPAIRNGINRGSRW